MIPVRFREWAVAFIAAMVLVWAFTAGLDFYHRHQGAKAEQVSTQQAQEADHHAQTAESIPGQSAELAAAQAEVDRLRKKLASRPAPLAPLPPVGSDGDQAGLGDVAVLHGQIAERDELIQAQDRQIGALKLALSDEQRRSGEFREAYEAERRATAAQAAATKAWKEAVTTSRWRGRIEGFALGAALGYVGGRR